jgi:hypothetical protein
MSTAGEIGAAIEQLRTIHPGALLSVDHASQRRIRLAPWAVEIAAELHNRFGDEVSLTVGLLAYPHPGVGGAGEATRPVRSKRDALPPPDRFEVRVDQPIEVRSGYSFGGAMHVRNLRAEELRLLTNGRVTGAVVDPSSGEVVGGFAGAQVMVGIQMSIPAGVERSIPLLVGTASRLPRLGYAVPPGPWAIEMDLTLVEGGRYRTPRFPLTVTE